MNDQDQDQLLSEILSGEDLAIFRTRSLASARTAMRSRTRRRRVAKVAIFASLPLVGAVLLLVHDKAAQTAKSVPTPAHLPLAQSQPADSNVRFISDEELLGLFPDRPVALIGQPGRQQLAFLDEPSLKKPVGGKL